MALYIIGLGLHDAKDITLRGLEVMKRCGSVYLEGYTSLLQGSIQEIEILCGKKVIVSDRNMVENNPGQMIEKAASDDIAFMVIGDPFAATTHTDLVLRAQKQGIAVHVIHNASILTAVGETGLDLYRFGRAASIPYPQGSWNPETPYDIIKQNLSAGLHTLCLLDIKADEGRFMTIPEAVELLLRAENKRREQVLTEETFCVGCARIGSPDAIIAAGTARQLKTVDFKKPLHCLIIPGKLHFVEEEALGRFSDMSANLK